MNKKSKSLLKVISATSVCVFSLMSVFTGVFAWFTNIRQQNNSAENLEIEADDINAKFFLYQVNTSTLEATDRGDNNTLLDIRNFSMNTYDTIFVARNKYTAALVRIQISGDSLKESGEISLTLNRDTTETWSDRTKLNQVISSIIDFKAGFDKSLYETLNSDTDNPINDMYNDARTLLKDEDPEIFITSTESEIVNPDEDAREETPTITVTNYDKIDQVVITTSYDSNEWVEIDGENCLNLYVLIDYNVDLVQAFTGTNKEFSTDKLNNPDSAFENDITTVIVNHD